MLCEVFLMCECGGKEMELESGKMQKNQLLLVMWQSIIASFVPIGGNDKGVVLSLVASWTLEHSYYVKTIPLSTQNDWINVMLRQIFECNDEVKRLQLDEWIELMSKIKKNKNEKPLPALHHGCHNDYYFEVIFFGLSEHTWKGEWRVDWAMEILRNYHRCLSCPWDTVIM